MTSAQLPLSLSHVQRSHIQANTGRFSPPLAFSWVTGTEGGCDPWQPHRLQLGIGLQECDISNLEICEEKREGERKKRSQMVMKGEGGRAGEIDEGEGRRQALGEERRDNLLFSEAEDT